MFSPGFVVARTALLLSNQSSEQPILNEVQYRTRGGDIKNFLTDAATCRPFGFYPGQRVLTVRGPAWVIGCHGTPPELYFHIDGDLGASKWTNYKEADFVQRNFTVIMNPVPPPPAPAPVVPMEFSAWFNTPALSDVVFYVRPLLPAQSPQGCDAGRGMHEGGAEGLDHTCPHGADHTCSAMMHSPSSSSFSSLSSSSSHSLGGLTRIDRSTTFPSFAALVPTSRDGSDALFLHDWCEVDPVSLIASPAATAAGGAYAVGTAADKCVEESSFDADSSLVPVSGCRSSRSGRRSSSTGAGPHRSCARIPDRLDPGRGLLGDHADDVDADADDDGASVNSAGGSAPGSSCNVLPVGAGGGAGKRGGEAGSPLEGRVKVFGHRIVLCARSEVGRPARQDVPAREFRLPLL